MNENYWNFYYYQIVREHPTEFELGSLDNAIRDEWRIYVVKAMNNDHLRRLADDHIEALNLEVTSDNKREVPWRKKWQLHAYGKFDYSQLNKGFPMLLATFEVPMDKSHDDAPNRSDINLTR